MPEWAWPSNNNWRIWCVSRFYVNKTIKQTYKGGLHFTVICCTNKCIINERYIPEHQNKLNIHDLQNYKFFTNFFSTEKKLVKFVIFYEWKKIRKIRILDLWSQLVEHTDAATCSQVTQFHTINCMYQLWSDFELTRFGMGIAGTTFQAENFWT